ncbi:MAG: S8 family serine peptidase [Bacteroidota bacterium]
MRKWLKLLFLSLTFPIQAQQLGFALEQINGQAIIDAGLTGKGVKIGVIDGDFLGAEKNESLRHLFESNRIAGYKDYLNPESKPFSGSRGFDDGHGTEVLELIAGQNAEKQVQYGLATEATFYLARTDHGGYESRKEEKNAIEAMEWMAKEGVRIINISLGYNFGYTNKLENYQPQQMDGKSTILTQAIDRISNQYDILFIVAAGNDGNKKWRIVGSPGDSKHALTVGATKFKVWDKMSYSSEGPEWLDYVKPEISCFSTLGTSFSTPIITGLAACLLEKDPSATTEELKSAIINSGNLTYPNNYIGHGVPDGEIALLALDRSDTLWDDVKRTAKKSFKLTLSNSSIYVTVYHKNGWKVLKKETIRTTKTNLKIRRKADATSSTVISEGGSLEVVWENKYQDSVHSFSPSSSYRK